MNTNSADSSPRPDTGSRDFATRCDNLPYASCTHVRVIASTLIAAASPIATATIQSDFPSVFGASKFQRSNVQIEKQYIPRRKDFKVSLVDFVEFVVSEVPVATNR